eukprot:8747233-Pyramimonas_sp.AAC.1
MMVVAHSPPRWMSQSARACSSGGLLCAGPITWRRRSRRSRSCNVGKAARSRIWPLVIRCKRILSCVIPMACRAADT